MNKSKPVTVNEVVSWLTGVNMEDACNALFERIKEISRQAALAIEKLKETEKIMDSDPVLGLLHAICDDDVEALSQLVSKYRLHNRNLSYFERDKVRQQLPKQPGIDNPNEFHDPIIEIAYSAVLIWLSTFPLNYSAYFSLPQEKREKIMASIMSRECRSELLGEISGLKKQMSIEEYEEYAQYRLKKGFPLEEYRLATYDNQPEDTSLDLEKLGFDINTLTKGKIRILYDEHNAYNQGVEGGSKQGRSRRQYWGKDYAKNMKMLERLKAKRQKT